MKLRVPAVIYLLWCCFSLIILFTSCHNKTTSGTKGKNKKTSVPEVAINPFRQQIVMHLVDKGNGKFESFLKDTSNGAICKIYFPPNSYDLAKSLGYSFFDVLNNTTDRTYTVFYRMMVELKIREIEISSLWRPYTPGNSHSPHDEGRAIDITRMVSRYGSAVFTSAANPKEQIVHQMIRGWCYPGNKDIVQYFSPWQMCNEKASCVGTCCPNDKTSPNHKLHLTHMHLTIKE